MVLSKKKCFYFALTSFILIELNDFCAGIEQISKGMGKTGSILYEMQRNLMFNKDKKLAWATGYLNRIDIEKTCSKSKPCFASDEVVPLCATDNQTYLNPGVLICAQQCNKALSIGKYGFGPCPIFPSTKETSEDNAHKSPANRLKVTGVLQNMLKWLGFHVHQDGGFYIADEKTHDAWWNV